MLKQLFSKSVAMICLMLLLVYYLFNIIRPLIGGDSTSSIMLSIIPFVLFVLILIGVLLDKKGLKIAGTIIFGLFQIYEIINHLRQYRMYGFSTMDLIGTLLCFVGLIILCILAVLYLVGMMSELAGIGLIAGTIVLIGINILITGIDMFRVYDYFYVYSYGLLPLMINIITPIAIASAGLCDEGNSEDY